MRDDDVRRAHELVAQVPVALLLDLTWDIYRLAEAGRHGAVLPRYHAELGACQWVEESVQRTLRAVRGVEVLTAPALAARVASALEGAPVSEAELLAMPVDARVVYLAPAQAALLALSVVQPGVEYPAQRAVQARVRGDEAGFLAALADLAALIRQFGWASGTYEVAAAAYESLAVVVGGDFPAWAALPPEQQGPFVTAARIKGELA